MTEQVVQQAEAVAEQAIAKTEATSVAEAAIEAVATETPTEGTVAEPVVSEVDTLKSKLAEYEAKLAKLEADYSGVDEEVKTYRSKKELLAEAEGLSPKALKALKEKQLWDLIDEAGMSEEELYTKIAEGRPQLSVEQMIAKKFEEIKKAEQLTSAKLEKERYENVRAERNKQLSAWLDNSDETKIEAELLDAHEILRTAREEKDLDVENIVLDMVEKSNVSYSEALKTLAEVFQKKVIKYSSLKSLDKEISKRYKTVDTPKSEPTDVDSNKIKTVIKTLEDKIEEAPMVAHDDEIIDENLSLDELVRRLKLKEKKKSSSLRRN